MKDTKWNPWQTFFCVIPRRIEGRIVWFQRAQYSTENLGALGLLYGLGRIKYRSLPND